MKAMAQNKNTSVKSGSAKSTTATQTSKKPVAKSAAPVKSQAKLAPAKTSQGKSAQVKPTQVKTGQVKTAPVKSHAAKPAVKSVKSEVRVVSKASPVKAAPAKSASAKPILAQVAKPNAAKPVAAKVVAAKAPDTAAAKPATVAPAALAGMIAARHNAAAAPRTIPSAITNPVAQTISAPAAATPAAVDPGARKLISTRHGFKTGEWIVYPSHGVGRIAAIEEQEIAGMALELFVITFEKDKMTLRVPTGKSQSVGMRKLADESVVKRALETLKGKARIKRTMWSRRAQEFEAKINSGDLVSIAEVVRDLFRADNQPEQSYSERQLYEAALDRMAREIAAVEKIDERGANQRITEILNKSAKGRRAAADEAAAAEIKAA